MLITLERELPEGGAGETVVSPFPQAIGVMKDLDDCRNYYLLDLSVRGGHAPGEPRIYIEKPALDEPLGCACGLSAAQAAGDPKDSFGGHIGDAVIDPPGGGDLSGFYRAIRRQEDLCVLWVL